MKLQSAKALMEFRGSALVIAGPRESSTKGVIRSWGIGTGTDTAAEHTAHRGQC